jgi:hypothetical protein
MVHLCSRISDDLDIFWQELVTVLSESVSVGGESSLATGLTYEAEQSWELSLRQLVSARECLE